MYAARSRRRRSAGCLAVLLLTQALAVVLLLAGQAAAAPGCPSSMDRGSEDWLLDPSQSSAPIDGSEPVERTMVLECVYLHPPPDDEDRRAGRMPGIVDVTFTASWVAGADHEAPSHACTQTQGANALAHGDKQAAVRWSWQMRAIGTPDDGLLNAFERHASRLLGTVARHAVDCPPEPDEPQGVEFIGFVYTTGDDGDWRTLDHVQVRLHLETPDGVISLDATTGGNGQYAAQAEVVPEETNLSVEVILRDIRGYLEVSSQAHGGDVIGYRTRPMAIEDELTAGAVFKNVQLAPPFENAAAWVPDTDLVHRAAFKYTVQERAASFAPSHLGLSYDHALPVEVILDASTYPDGGPVDSLSYGPTESAIYYPPGDSGLDDGDRVQGDYHEWGHHVHEDSGIGGEDASIWVQGQTPHAGHRNSDSTDSFSEGLATFYGALVEADGGLPGSVAGFEINGQTWVDGLPFEEFGVTALLWDLADADDEPGDHFNLGARRVIELINQGSVGNVRTLYEALHPVLGSQDTDADDGLCDLDRLFVLHKFYSDTNGDDAWTPDPDDAGPCKRGEPVGWADYLPPAVRNDPAFSRSSPDPRPSPVPLRSTELGLELLGAPAPPTGSHLVEIRASYVDATFDHANLARLAPAEGSVQVVVPGEPVEISIRPLVSGMQAEPVTFTAAAYHDAVAQATAADQPRFAEANVTLEQAQLPAPRGFQAVDRMDGLVQLSWDPVGPGEEILLVRTAGSAPSQPGQGTLVYRGSGANLTDDGSPGGVQVGYAAFLLDGSGAVSRPAVATVTTAKEPIEVAGAAEAGDDGDGPSIVWLVVGVGALLIAYYLWTGKRGPPPTRHAPPGGYESRGKGSPGGPPGPG